MLDLNLLGAIFILAGAIVPAYLSLKLHNRLRWLTFVLTLFCIVHSFYHLSLANGNAQLANNVLEPASVVLLLAFGAIYLIDLRFSKRVHS